jgi:hypothetical protein
MKHAFTLLLFVFVSAKMSAQIGPAELMVGHRYIHYQHSLSNSIKTNSKIGWQHIATLIKRYNTNTEKNGLPDELMNQVYLTARINSFMAIKGGLFYTNVGGFKPSIGLQFMVRKKSWMAIASPRVDIARNAAYEMFAVAEYTPSLSANTRLYARLQAMSSINARQHNRSYQQIRIGAECNGFQFGGGLTLDEYGTNRTVYYNKGIFIRKVL